MRYVVDSCAWHCLRGLKTDAKSLLQCLFDADRSFMPVALTEYVARNELSVLLTEIQQGVAAGFVAIQRIERRDPNWKRMSRICDKGEAEVITWLLSLRPEVRPLFVTRDSGARRAAITEGLYATDVLGLTIDMMRIGCLTQEALSQALAVWNDKSQQICRPSDWAGLESVQARSSRGYPFGPKAPRPPRARDGDQLAGMGRAPRTHARCCYDVRGTRFA